MRHPTFQPLNEILRCARHGLLLLRRNLIVGREHRPAAIGELQPSEWTPKHVAAYWARR
jgi:hypothetical protein